MKYFVLFIVGAILGTLFDHFHTEAGLVVYTQPWLWDQAWWVSILFGVGAVLIGFTHLSLDQRLGRYLKTQSWSEVLSGVVLFGVLYFVSAHLQVQPATKSIVFCLYALAFWQVLDSTAIGLVTAFCVAVMGCLAEIILVNSGLFRYTELGVAGIPVWLPFLYIVASVVIGNLARLLAV